jgi:conjugative transfer signal peptidase TraF
MNGRMAILATAIGAVLSQLASAIVEVPTMAHQNPTPRAFLPKLLLWNASASVPRGLYLLRPTSPLHVGELVTVAPPEPLARFAAMRGYLPIGVPLLKHIAALDGQTVCRFARVVRVDGRAVAIARERDSVGRSLPSWQGCRTLRAGQVFLLNSTIPDSFDGRYFGVLPANSITARAEPLWIISEH